mmetsp:Transcript_10557/g.17259  ORF Transcript_10557/g.17259 Transcript_10557/m.17259 type:complete len:504 (+) Transcript_10557:58-1569(+)
MECTFFLRAPHFLILLWPAFVMSANAMASSAQVEIRSGAFMELEAESSKSLRTMANIIADAQHLSEDAYVEQVLKSGSEDVLERWWRRQSASDGKPPSAVPDSMAGHTNTSEGLYEKIQRKRNEVRRARLLRQEASHKVAFGSTGISQQTQEAEKGNEQADASEAETPSNVEGIHGRVGKFKVSIHPISRSEAMAMMKPTEMPTEAPTEMPTEMPKPARESYKVTEELSQKAPHGQCAYKDLDKSAFGFSGCVPNALASVHLVVSAFDSKIAWLADVHMPMTIYVHNRSAKRGRCISNGQGCVAEETPAKLHEAAESQRQLLAKSKNRAKEQQIQIFDVPNIGDEALAFLMHIVGHYDLLPDYVFFTHDHQCAWHSKFDMAAILARAQLCVPANDIGYMTLNDPDLYNGQPSCFSTSSGEQDAKHIFSGQAQTIRRMWPVLFESEFGRLPPKFCMDCCAQFVVSRERIRSHPLDFYKRALNAVKAGRTSFEYFWRTLFVPHFA